MRERPDVFENLSKVAAIDPSAAITPDEMLGFVCRLLPDPPPDYFPTPDSHW
jgi:hypothetical protein